MSGPPRPSLCFSTTPRKRSVRWPRRWADSTSSFSRAGSAKTLAEARTRICEGLEFLGIRLDLDANAAGEAVISSAGLRAQVRVIRTDEESMIARDVAVAGPNAATAEAWIDSNPLVRFRNDQSWTSQFRANCCGKMDAYWRAANYLSVGQIYLYDNPLLTEPLKLEHVKPRLLGHWGTTPGQNFIYVHLNRIIKAI